MNQNKIVRWSSLLLNFVVRSNFIIAISGGVLIAGIADAFSQSNYADYAFFGFYSTFFVYNGQGLFRVSIEDEIPIWFSKHRLSILVLTLISFFLALYYLFKVIDELSIAEVIIFGVSIPLAFFYVVPIKGESIRNRPHLKAHATAFAWTGVMVVFPMIKLPIKDGLAEIIFAFALYCYFLAITISFDIRDLKFDLPTRKTVPQVFGTTTAKIIAILLLTFSGVSIGIMWSVYFNNLLFAIAFLVPITLIAFARKNYHDYYYTILIDGSISFLGISFLIG